MTYTFVRYFGGDRLATLEDAYLGLRRDFESRRAHLAIGAAEAMEMRLELLHHAIALLSEPVPKPFGG